MYNVQTVITPITYGCNLQDAILQYNGTTKGRGKDKATRLDIRILEVLRRADIRGIRAMKVRQMASEERTVFSAVFNSSINRLIAWGYITRRAHKNAVYYTITKKGLEVLDHVEQILIEIVNGYIKDVK